jgi:hypothetical protein
LHISQPFFPPIRHSLTHPRLMHRQCRHLRPVHYRRGSSCPLLHPRIGAS